MSGKPPDRMPEPVIVAESTAMRQAVQLARRFAATGLPVLLVGETGTGKEVLAQAIHRWSGRSGELVDVDCGAFPAGMAIGEMFGHRRGAYTTAVESAPGLIERAHNGTLFLDELGSLPPEAQMALLRVLETGEVRRIGDHAKIRVRIRLVAALQVVEGAQLTGHHRIRLDLYHRLTGTVISLPPLRQRPEDLFPLATHLAAGIHRTLSPLAERVLTHHLWPGNIRELRHVIARAASLSDSMELDAATVAEALDLSRIAEELLGRTAAVPAEHEHGRSLLDLCRRHGGRPDAIAGALGVSRSTLFRRLREAGVSLRSFAALELTPE